MRRPDLHPRLHPSYTMAGERAGVKEQVVQSGLMRAWRPMLAMTVLIVASNFLVQFPIDVGPVVGLPLLITYGAFTYPATFLTTDLTNRRYGPAVARRV